MAKSTASRSKKPAPTKTTSGRGIANADRLELGPEALGVWLGIGGERVRQFAVEGVFKRAERGRYPVKANVIAYIAWLKDEQRRASKGKAAEQVELERARKLRIENDESERLTLRMDDAIAAVDAIVGPIKSELAGIAPRVTDDLEQRRRIEDAIDAVLGDLATRFREASAALRAGLDPLAPGAEDQADGLGAEEEVSGDGGEAGQA